MRGRARELAPTAPKSGGANTSHPSPPAVEQAQVKPREVHGWGRPYRLGAEHPNSRKPTCSGFWPRVQRARPPGGACSLGACVGSDQLHISGGLAWGPSSVRHRVWLGDHPC